MLKYYIIDKEYKNRKSIIINNIGKPENTTLGDAIYRKFSFIVGTSNPFRLALLYYASHIYIGDKKVFFTYDKSSAFASSQSFARKIEELNSDGELTN